MGLQSPFQPPIRYGPRRRRRVRSPWATITLTGLFLVAVSIRGALRRPRVTLGLLLLLIGALWGWRALRPPSSALPSVALVTRYGATHWVSIEGMPSEVRTFYLGTVQEVANFFDVRPQDIMGILRAERNGTGWALAEPRVSAAGARGVAQIVSRTWNGWANPRHSPHARSLAEIEQYGGIGFDWQARTRWQAWQMGLAPHSALAQTNADPSYFENSVAAIARHLAHWGLSPAAAQADPVGFEMRLADAVAVYNSGRPLAQSQHYTQSAGNRKTVGAYVAEVLATSRAVASYFER